MPPQPPRASVAPSAAANPRPKASRSDLSLPDVAWNRPTLPPRRPRNAGLVSILEGFKTFLWLPQQGLIQKSHHAGNNGRVGDIEDVPLKARSMEREEV